jgi:PKD repeat protein
VVDAGPNRNIQTGQNASLDGTVTDDGRPTGSLTTTWTKITGPGTVTFGNAAAVDTTASFSQAGTYVLQLTATDGQLTTTDTMTVVVTAPNVAPVVDAGPDRNISSAGVAALDGTVTDDSQPNATPSVQWTKVSGPGTVTFGNTAAVDTTATFSQAGTYMLRLTANDGALSASDTMTVVVQAGGGPVNTPPSIIMPANQTITLPASASLSATVTDAGGPLATPLLNWSRVSGPGTVTFGSPTSSSTTASFSTDGTYVLRLTANDGELQTFADVTITVLAAPTTSSSRILTMRRR